VHVVVIGAGAFGTWTALWLQRRGATVTLVEQYGPGNSLSSSGDESRVTRSAHGPDDHYPIWQRRSLTQWLDLVPDVFVPTGVLWLARTHDGFEHQSAQTLSRLGIAHELLDAGALRTRYPQIGTDDVAWGLYEPNAGVLLARRAVAATARSFTDDGGSFRIGLARVEGESVLVDGEPLEADAFVFAAGPWLPKLLGDVPGLEMTVPQQEVIYFATPPGDRRFDAGVHPTWVEYDAAFYGLPSIEGRGFKVAPDWPGPLVDPDRQERRISDERIEASRAYLLKRFPALADQPVAEGRVCQHELTVDTHFIIDRHPRFEAGWVVGGGSGHGFKHAPAVGEYLSGLVLGEDVIALAPPDDRFALRPRSAGVGMRTSGASPVGALEATSPNTTPASGEGS
jgi:glycine/D-amino acid oxidase-like deaminating enzyme